MYGRRRTTAGSARPRAATSLALAVGLAALVPALPGCDNAACVFQAGGCAGTTTPTGPGTSTGTFASFIPVDGDRVVDTAPVLLDAVPNLTASSTSPIVLVFSETMAFDTLTDAFQIQLVDTMSSASPPSLQPPYLVGDGHVVVLLPVSALEPNDYNVVIRENAQVTDLTGQLYVPPQSGTLASFTVPEIDPTTPVVLSVFPLDGAIEMSPTAQVVVVFDRRMSSSSFDTDSFKVEVDGVTPVPNPPPQPLVLSNNTPETRVYLYRSEAPGIGVVGFGVDALVDFQLSAPGSPLFDSNPISPQPLPETNFRFFTGPVEAPLDAQIVSTPSDAIGVANVTGAATLLIDVTVADGQPGDVLSTFVYGSRETETGDAILQSIRRDITLSAVVTTVPITAADLALLETTLPPKGLFEDGDLAFAFRLSRGTAVSPIFRLDVDPGLPGIQDPLQDLVPPVFQGFGTSASSLSTLRSDQRELVVIGRASEKLKSCLVTLVGTGQTNSPNVSGSDDNGLFIASPVRVGIVDPSSLPTRFSMELSDRALNTTTVSNRLFDQLGHVGPDVVLSPPGDVFVQVFDATTMDPVSGATVLLHRDVSGVIDPVSTGTTNSNGIVQVPGPASGETIVTVAAVGFDLFTFHGIPANRISVPLYPSSFADAMVSGSVTTPQLTVNSYALQIADNRIRRPSEIFRPVNVCVPGPFGGDLDCPYPAIPMIPGIIGAQTFLATDPPPDEPSFDPIAFLGGFSLLNPIEPAVVGTTQHTELELPLLLDDPLVDPEDYPIGVPSFLLLEPPVGTDPAQPDFAFLDGFPRVSVEGLTPGQSYPVTVGAGVAFGNVGPGAFTVRAAYPGAVDSIDDMPAPPDVDLPGSLVLAGTILPDLMVRCEFVDQDGNRTGARPHLSALGASVATMNVPTVLAPVPEGPAGGASFNLAFVNSIEDAYGPNALYQAVLRDQPGRRWRLYRLDVGNVGNPNVVIHVPDLAGAPGLTPGDLFCTVSALVFPPGSISVTSYLWSDVWREHDEFADAATIRWDYPN